MGIGLVEEVYGPPEDLSWLGKAHGHGEMDSITLDASAFLATFTDGIVPSGVVISQLNTGAEPRLYVPYAGSGSGATDGSAVAAGHLGTTKNLKGTTAGTAQDVGAALFWHGEVIVSKLPDNNGLDAGARTALKHIRYREI